MSFKFNLQLFAQVENPHTVQGSETDSVNPHLKVYTYNFPEGFVKRWGSTYASTNETYLSRWFAQNIPDIKTINSLYDSVSPNKTFFDNKVVNSGVIDELFFKTNFTNTDEINKIVSKIFLNNVDSYRSVQMERMYMGINMDYNESNDTYHVKQFPNNFKLKPKFNTGFSGITIRYCLNENETYPSTIFGGAFVNELDVTDVKLAELKSSNTYSDCVFRRCIAQKVKGLETYPFNRSSSASNKTFEGMFNLDPYINKIDDPEIKKKIKSKYYNVIDIYKAYYGEIKLTENNEPLFEYWRPDKVLRLTNLGKSFTRMINLEDHDGSYSGSRNVGDRRFFKTFSNAYLFGVELTKDIYMRYCYSYESMFEGASMVKLKIGSKIGAVNRYMGNYKNMFNFSTKGPFKLHEMDVTIVFPDEEYLTNLPWWAKREFINNMDLSPKQADMIKNMLPSADCMVKGLRNRVRIKLVNFNVENMLSFVQEYGYPEITTEDQLFEFMGGCPKDCLVFEEKTRNDYMGKDNESHASEA